MTEMRNGSAADVEEYVQRPYRMEIYWDGDYWAAEFPELPGLVAGHETWDGLEAAIEEAKRSYFEAAIAGGRSIPVPTAEQETFSGRLMVRLPKSLHSRAARAARSEGVSLNTLISTAVAKEIGWNERRQGAATPSTIAPRPRARAPRRAAPA